MEFPNHREAVKNVNQFKKLPKSMWNLAKYINKFMVF